MVHPCWVPLKTEGGSHGVITTDNSHKKQQQGRWACWVGRRLPSASHKKYHHGSSVQMDRTGGRLQQRMLYRMADLRPLTKPHGSPLVGVIENRRREPRGNHHGQLSQKAMTVGSLGGASSSPRLISIPPHHVPPRHHAVGHDAVNE